MSVAIEPGRFGSGHAVRRIEDPTLVSGRGQFADDISLPGQTYAAFVRSTCAHAVLKSVDVDSARAMPGVLAVYTGADLVAAGVKAMPGPTGFTRPDGSAAASAPLRALAHDRVRFVGEAVALVVAETLEAARAAADAIFVDYEELPAVTEPFDALRPGAPQLCDTAPDNIPAEMRHGDAEKAAAA